MMNKTWEENERENQMDTRSRNETCLANHISTAVGTLFQTYTNMCFRHACVCVFLGGITKWSDGWMDGWMNDWEGRWERQRKERNCCLFPGCYLPFNDLIWEQTAPCYAWVVKVEENVCGRVHGVGLYIGLIYIRMCIAFNVIIQLIIDAISMFISWIDTFFS